MITAEVWLHPATPPPGDGTWIAVGESGFIMRSIDNGATWSDVTPGASTGNYLYGVATDGTDWVASGENGDIWQSTDDGITWGAITSPAVAEDWLRACSPEPGVFLIQSRYKICRSINGGATFSTVTQSLTPTNEFYTFATDGAGNVMLGCNIGSPNDTYAYSNDSGATWNAYTTGTGLAATGNVVSYANGFWIISDVAERIQYTNQTPPSAWSTKIMSGQFTGNVGEYVWDGTYFFNNNMGNMFQGRQPDLATNPTFASLADRKDIYCIASNGSGTTVLIKYDDIDVYTTNGSLVLTNITTGFSGDIMNAVAFKA